MSKLVYLAGPISGLSFDDATTWRQHATDYFSVNGIDAISPLRGAGSQPDKYFNPNGERWTSMKAIVTRDHFDVKRCDAVLINFLGARRISKGTMMEIAWAHAYGKPVVQAIEDPYKVYGVADSVNPNWDVFANELIGFTENTLEQALDTMRLLLSY